MQKALHHAGLFALWDGSICKNYAVLFTFCKNYGIIQLLDKLEFAGDFYVIGCIDTSYICGIVPNGRYCNVYQNDISTKEKQE